MMIFLSVTSILVGLLCIYVGEPFSLSSLFIGISAVILLDELFDLR